MKVYLIWSAVCIGLIFAVTICTMVPFATISMDSASMEIDFTAELIKDPDDEWKKSYLAYMRELYDEYIIKARIEDHEVKIFEEVNDIINSMKAYLAIEGQHA